jgi:hypothetical protein
MEEKVGNNYTKRLRTNDNGQVQFRYIKQGNYQIVIIGDGYKKWYINVTKDLTVIINLDLRIMVIK